MSEGNALVTAAGEAFLPALAAGMPPETWENTLALMPTARAAGRLKALLAKAGSGILPRVQTLRDSEKMAEILGFELPKTVDMWALRGEVYRRLEATETAEKRALMAKELADLMNRLALHGVVNVCEDGRFPDGLRGYFEVQASVLLGVSEGIVVWLSERGAVLPGAAERMALERAAAALEAGGSVVPVWAGIWDTSPAGAALARAVVARGRVVLPAYGPATAALASELLGQEVAIAGAMPAVTEVVADDDWQEVRLAALAVKRALALGQRRVAIVCPARSVLERVGCELRRWGIEAAHGPGLRAAETPLGRQFCAAAAGLLAGEMRGAAEWRAALAADGTFDEVAAWLAPLDALEGRWSGADYATLACVALEETVLPQVQTTPGVWLLGALEARLLDFDSVVVMQCVDSVWPGTSYDAWLSEPHLRALGLPDAARRAQLAHAEFESLVAGGSASVIVTRPLLSEGRETVPSRFLNGVTRVADPDLSTELKGALAVLEQRQLPVPAGLGTFVPHAPVWPEFWSASLVESLLACPYRALGERVLKLEPPAPQLPVPDPRDGGMVAHRWLELAGNEPPEMLNEARLLALGEVALRGFDAVVRAIWRPKMAKLAPVLLAEWARRGHATLGTERRMESRVGSVTVRATFDRIERGPQGAVVVDYKTGTPPAWSKVADGTKPQLALEAWLLAQNGIADVADLELWHLRGYGATPLRVTSAAASRDHDVASLTAPVGDGLSRLASTFGDGQPWPAVPDRSGGGLAASGHCEHCALAGVCRRQDGLADERISGLAEHAGGGPQ